MQAERDAIKRRYTRYRNNDAYLGHLAAEIKRAVQRFGLDEPVARLLEIEDLPFHITRATGWGSLEDALLFRFDVEHLKQHGLAYKPEDYMDPIELSPHYLGPLWDIRVNMPMQRLLETVKAMTRSLNFPMEHPNIPRDVLHFRLQLLERALEEYEIWGFLGDYVNRLSPKVKHDAYAIEQTIRIAQFVASKADDGDSWSVMYPSKEALKNDLVEHADAWSLGKVIGPHDVVQILTRTKIWVTGKQGGINDGTLQATLKNLKALYENVAKNGL